jgi:predicted nucleic acid-binding Zn ribbon protein
MALSPEEIDRIREEERVRHDAQEEIRQEQERKKRTMNALGWLFLLIVLFVIAQKFPEWQREQRDREQFRQTLDSIVNR